MTSIVGLVLLVLLLSYDEEGYRSVAQSIAFAGTVAFCLTVASIVPYQYVYGLPTAREPQLVTHWLPLTWAFVTLLVGVIDRARMGARAPVARPGAAAVGSMFTPRPTAAPVPTPSWTPAPSASPVSTPAPAYASPQPAPPSAVPLSYGGTTPTVEPRLVRDEPVAAPPPPPAPPVKLVEIYVHLTGESLNLMRSVMAEPLGRDYFRIVDTMPENETWQFTPGQVVRCKKQNLSTGKAMVAIEEAPRAQ